MRRLCPCAALLLLALTTPACSRKEPPIPAQPEPTAPPSAASSAARMEAPPAPLASVVQGAPSAESPNTPPASPADQAERAAKHKAAFARARGAMKAKDYKKAIQFYDAARDVLSEDAQTMGERGYAKFLSGDKLGGEVDLDAATALKGDAKTLAQVWYNLGVAYEERGMAELSRTAFAASVSLSPSKAAEDKLQGKSRCAASTSPPQHRDALVVKGWLGVWSALNKPSAENPKPKTEAAAKDELCTGRFPSPRDPEGERRCKGSMPWIVTYSLGEYGISDALVVPAGPEKFFVLDVGPFGPGACISYTLVDSEVLPKVVRAKYTYVTKYWVESTPLGGGDSTLECVAGGTQLLDIIYDRATGKGLVAVERSNDLVPPIAMKVLPDEGVVTVTGHGCNERLLLTPAAPE